MTFGKTRNDAKGGVAERRVAVDQKDWFVGPGSWGRMVTPGAPKPPGSEAARRSRAALDGAYRDPGASKGA